MIDGKFGVGDGVRLVGTETLQTVREYNAATLEYRIQPGDDDASSQWVLAIYLELINPVGRAGLEAAG
jgi:hypothetical protein